MEVRAGFSGMDREAAETAAAVFVDGVICCVDTVGDARLLGDRGRSCAVRVLSMRSGPDLDDP